jgi:two-component system phosphate regulon response regulator PhoB
VNNTTAYKILLVEDSDVMKDLVSHALGSDFEILLAPNLEIALNYISQNQFDLILLDVGLPDGDGFRFFSMLQNHHLYKLTPVIFLTANSDTSAKVLGISLGAEDYIVKPFVTAEFKARVEMRVKKHYKKQKEDQIIRKGDIEINFSAQRAYVYVEEKKINLQLAPLEFKLLSLLSTHEDQVFSRDQLFDKVWGEDIFLTDRSVDTQIYTLRKKLGKLGIYINTVYGEGYRFSINKKAA